MDQGTTNRSADGDLEAIEEDRLPGTNTAAKIFNLRQRLAGENPTLDDGVGVAPVKPTRLDLNTETQLTKNQGLSAPNAGSLSPLIGSVLEGNNMFNKVAWVIENGEIKCASCERYYVPQTFEQTKTAHCGFPGCADAEGKVDYTKEGMEFIPNGNAENHFTLAAGKIEEGDMIDGDVIKTGEEDEEKATRETKSWLNFHPRKRKINRQMTLSSTQDYVDAFTKEANDSDLYYRGYMDGLAGKPLDETLAEVADDYFHGYDQAKHYNLKPQESSPQVVYDIKANSNLIPRAEETPKVFNAGPAAVAASKTASEELSKVFPVDVVNKFFIEE